MKLMRRTFRLTLRSLQNPKSPSWLVSIFLLISPVLLTSGTAQGQAKPDQDYLVYVLSEAADKISLIRFGPGGARVERELQTGEMPVDIDGPHGLAVSPD